jgi:hypothetical protein
LAKIGSLQLGTSKVRITQVGVNQISILQLAITAATAIQQFDQVFARGTGCRAA